MTGQQQPLVASAATMRRLAESGLIAVATVAPDRIVDANGAFRRLIGYSAAEVAAGLVDWRALTPPRWAAADRAALDELKTSGFCAPFRKEYVRQDGSRVPVEVGAVLLSRDPLRWVVAVRDTSAERDAEVAAQRARQLADLTAALGQDLTIADVARTLAAYLRSRLGANMATIIEVDAAQERMRFVHLGDVPAEVAGQWAEFDISVDSPAVRSWRGRQPVFFGDPGLLDKTFPHLAGARTASGAGSCLTVPLISGGDVEGLLAVTWPGPHQLTAADESFIATVGSYTGQALARARSLEAERAARAEADAARDRAVAVSQRELTARQHLQVLQAVTAGLARAVTSEEIAEVLIRDGLGLIAAHGVVAVLSTADEYLCTWTTGNFPAEIGHAYARIPRSEMDATPVGQTARTGQGMMLASLKEIAGQFPQTLFTHAATGTSSLLTVPLRGAGRTVGALAFGFPAEGPPDPQVVSMASTLAELVGQALERARMYELEHAAAHRLQRALLPEVPDRVAGVEIAIGYRPAEQGHDVGGDWYDVFELPGGRVGCAVGDVAGHDLAAAAAMSRLQLLLRYVARSGAGPAQVLEQLDQACPAMTGADFVTVAYAEYDPATRHLTYACAGHLPPFLIADGQGHYLNEGRCGPLGFAGAPTEATVVVPAGALLVLYTDGLVERRGRSIDEGLGQLAEAAIGSGETDPQTLCHALLSAMTEDEALADDLAIACIGTLRRAFGLPSLLNAGVGRRKAVQAENLEQAPYPAGRDCQPEFGAIPSCCPLGMKQLAESRGITENG